MRPAALAGDRAMNKEPKNRQELTRMIMELIRQRPEWNDVLRVAIIVEWNRTASNLPNWDAAFTVDSPRVAPDDAFILVNELRNKYELSES
jgi:hypothetical protein